MQALKTYFVEDRQFQCFLQLSINSRSGCQVVWPADISVTGQFIELNSSSQILLLISEYLRHKVNNFQREVLFCRWHKICTSWGAEGLSSQI